MPHEETTDKTNEKYWVLDEQDFYLVAFVEEYFWLNEAKSPPVEEIVAGLGWDQKLVHELLRHPAINEFLNSRGIENPVTAPVKHDGLSAKQLMLANMLLNHHDAHSTREKLKMLGITSMQYHAWMTDKRFSDYVQRRANQSFIGAEWEIKQSLVHEAVQGDIPAQTLYFKLRGMLSERYDVNVNIDALVPQLVEVVANNVMRELGKDAAERVMIQIANDLEILIQTGSVPVPINDEFKVLEVSSHES